MTHLDVAACLVFAVAWLAYEPLLSLLSARRGNLNKHMEFVRKAWMRRMLGREVRIADTNIMGQVLNSASFFGSTNLLIIAAAAGVLFGGDESLHRLEGLASFSAAPPIWVVRLKLALVIITLAQGLLNFVWSIRQVNYSLALVGAAPDHDAKYDVEAYAEAAAGVLNGAVRSFNRGVRGYYFALAAAAWLASPWAMGTAAVAAFVLLVWRQLASPAARSMRGAHEFLQNEPKL
jgi:uncharacterized membrane protein